MTDAYVRKAAVESQSASQLRKGAPDGTGRERERERERERGRGRQI